MATLSTCSILMLSFKDSKRARHAFDLSSSADAAAVCKTESICVTRAAISWRRRSLFMSMNCLVNTSKVEPSEIRLAYAVCC
jgi:hypothetical protein